MLHLGAGSLSSSAADAYADRALVTRPQIPRRPLGGSGIEVSVLSLGSWRTYERIPRERALAVMEVARSAGVDFLDDARYDDETGDAPIPSGWSEVLFGELFRESGWPRREATLANKLWWEFWPEQSAMQELDESLGRTGFHRLDLEYSAELPDGLSVERAVEEIAGLLASGKLRTWGVVNWTASQLVEATRAARALGIDPPCAVQLPYSLVRRDFVEEEAMQAALADAGASVVASASLAGGALSGKYAAAREGRLAGELDNPRYARALTAGERLAEIARRIEASPAALAYAFCLRHPSVASVLFGATSSEQVVENVTAVELLERVDEETWLALEALA
jgi:aryl-alcohol dehydrogenase-like predicted oxidoreductase